MLSGFENETATFFTEQSATDWDPVKEEEVNTTESEPEFIDVPVRAEQADAEYVQEVHGEWPMEVYTLYVDPLDIGSVDNGEYKLGVATDDLAELAGVTGRFSLQPPNLQRLDSQVPEYVELEIVKIAGE